MTTPARACHHCHTPLPAGAHFCLNCGTPTPTEPGVPEPTIPTGAVEVSRVRIALADRYRIERVLGEGGMATVYLAEDLKHHRRVAVKVMRPELAETLGAERFLREVEIAAKLSHPHILPVHDSGSEGGLLYYVMPLVEGESLAARLSGEKQLPVAEALRLAREVAEALAYAHRHDVIHRDIKPANILLHEGHALVADFGIARATSDAAGLTKTGLAIGTPTYMSPEQSSGDPNVDGRTDIYALGSVLYEMLAGEPPFTGPTAQAIITRSITEAPRPLTSTRAAIPPAVNTAVLKALAKSPADRYPSAKEMVAKLSGLEVESQSALVSHASTIDHKLSSRWKAASVALLVATIGFVGLRLVGGDAAAGASTPKRVAVLPFENLGSPDEAYFTDGLVDELRTRLARLDGLTIIASSSADQYRGTTKPPTEIARELRVDQVLSGTVRWANDAEGNREFRVTTELVDGQSGQVSWRNTFEGTQADPFSVQGQIATRVAAALGAVLADSQAPALAGRPTENAEAYDLYLKAITITGEQVGVGVMLQRQAAGLLERAVALDSTFAAAWTRLADALVRQYTNGSRDPLIARRAREVLDRALALAPDSATAHLAAANYYSAISGDQVAAHREVEKAIRLDLRNLRAIRSMADFALDKGDFQAAFDHLSRARELDPRNPVTLSALIEAQLATDRYAEAVTTADELSALALTNLGQMENVGAAYLANNGLASAKSVVAEFSQRVSATDLVAYLAGYQEMGFLLSDSQRQLLYRLTPASFDNDMAWWGQALAIAAWQEGDSVRARFFADSSLAVAREQIAATPDDAQLRMLNALALAIAGHRTEALSQAEEAIADTVGARSAEISYDLLTYVRTLVAAGEHERALDNLEVLLQRPYFVTPGWIKSDPSFRTLARYPRFERLTNRGIGKAED